MRHSMSRVSHAFTSVGPLIYMFRFASHVAIDVRVSSAHLQKVRNSNTVSNVPSCHPLSGTIHPLLNRLTVGV